MTRPGSKSCPFPRRVSPDDARDDTRPNCPCLWIQKVFFSKEILKTAQYHHNTYSAQPTVNTFP